MAHYKHLMERRLQQSEQRFVTMLRSIGDGVIVTDLVGRVTFVNAAGATLIAIAPEEALGRLLSEVLGLVDGTTNLPITHRNHPGDSVSFAVVPYFRSGRFSMTVRSGGFSRLGR